MDVESIFAESESRRIEKYSELEAEIAAHNERVHLLNHREGWYRASPADCQFGYGDSTNWPDFYRYFASGITSFVERICATHRAHRLQEIDNCGEKAGIVAQQIYSVAETGDVDAVDSLLRRLWEKCDHEFREEVLQFVRFRIPSFLIDGPPRVDVEPADSSESQRPPENLNAREAAAWQAAFESPGLKGDDLAAKAGYSNSGSFKEAVAGLVRRGLMTSSRKDGYRAVTKVGT